MAATHNDVLYNAALSGFLRGYQAGRATPIGIVAGTITAAQAFATAVDAAIPYDAGISAAGPGTAPLSPTTGAIVGNQIAKAGILEGICFGLYAERVQTDTVTGDYNAQAALIATAYALAAAAVTVA